jgi:hypothetical protein
MRKILFATAAVGMLAAFSLAPQQAQARDCVRLTATAQGVTQGIATRKAERRLQRYISRNLAGARVGDHSTSCTGWGEEGFRAACESSAIACR